jgi:hypothetical protein
MVEEFGEGRHQQWPTVSGNARAAGNEAKA